jgi:hypothetical protein
MRRGIAFGTVAVAGLTLTAFLAGARCSAADNSILAPAEHSVPDDHLNSVLVFGGRMSTEDIWSTVLFNLNWKGSGPQFDNYIVGAAYDRDLLNFGHGFHFGVEVGIADRFGHYKECCDSIIKSNSIVQSAEFWAGPQLRYDGIPLFDLVRIGGGLTVGLSAATAPIGRELERQIEAPGNARLLYYLGPEIDVSFPSLPDLEFVLKLQHRSGGAQVSSLPTLGHMAEGYNADVFGIRWRF